MGALLLRPGEVLKSVLEFNNCYLCILHNKMQFIYEKCVNHTLFSYEKSVIIDIQLIL